MKENARIFKALAEATRLRILALLLEGELCVCEIIAALELPQSTISRHLAYLRSSDWVQDRRQGLWAYYRLNDSGHALLKELKPLLERYLTKNPEHTEALNRLHAFRNKQDKQAC